MFSDNGLATRPTLPLRGPMILYPRSPLGHFPTSGVGYPSSATNFMVLGMKDGDEVGELLTGNTYWLTFENNAAQSNTNRITLCTEVNGLQPDQLHRMATA